MAEAMIRRRPSSWAAALTVAGVVASAGVAGVLVATAAQAAEVYPRPTDGRLTFVGRGFGHGIGMSQFGAEGMGRSGKTYQQILAFYYPGTRFASTPMTTGIRVHLSAAPTQIHGRAAVTVAAANTTFAHVARQPFAALPRRAGGARVTAYRVVRSDQGLALVAISARAHRVVVPAQPKAIVLGTAAPAPAGSTSAATPTPDASRVTVRNGGADRDYHGYLRVQPYGSGVAAVNVVRLQQYLYGVVGAEVPDGWTRAAYRAQAVAARSYALLLRQIARHTGAPWDICDTTCQSYGGVAWESASQNAAVDATAGQYLSYHGDPVLAMFSSADGGYTVAGSHPYLVARPDPYDGIVTGAANWGHAWDTTVTAGTIEADWPQIGRLKAVVVAARDGLGRWGGRVTALRLRGTAGSVVVSPDTFRWTLGLKSTWWRIAATS